MLGLDFLKKEDFLVFCDSFNKGGRWVPYHTKLIRDSKENSAWFSCFIPIDREGGPYLYTYFDNHTGEEIKFWKIPVKINQVAYSWDFLVRGLFDELDIPCNKDDEHTSYESTHPTENLDKLLDTSKGKELMKKVSEREYKFTDILVNKVVGIEFFSKNSYTMKSGAINIKDRFELLAKLEYWPARDLDFNLENNFRESQNGLILPRLMVERLIPKNY